MSTQTLRLLHGLNSREIEKQLAMQCAPLIAGLKISNLLIVPNNIEGQVRHMLSQTPLLYVELYKSEKKTTYLVYSKILMERFLQKECVHSFLRECGYESFNLADILAVFTKRYSRHMIGNSDFPHEMGILLGYPVEDIRGFISDDGRNPLYTGYWKVYCDLEEKIRLFAQFDNAQVAIVKLLTRGMHIQDVIDIYSQDMQNAMKVAI